MISRNFQHMLTKILDFFSEKYIDNIPAITKFGVFSSLYVRQDTFVDGDLSHWKRGKVI